MTAPSRRLVLSNEGRLIFAARALRSFAFGWLSIVLALYLDLRGLSPVEIGAIFTATMVEDALLTLFLSTVAARLGPARVMALTAPLIGLGGLLLATAESRSLLFAGAVLGTLSPNGQEAGAFAPMEQALLPGAVRSGTAVRAFGWYNVFAFLPSALGAAAAGGALGWALRSGVVEVEASWTPVPLVTLLANAEHDVGRLPEGGFDLTLVGTKLRLNLSPNLQLDSFVQYEAEGRTFGTNTRLRWTFRPRGDVFLIYNHNLREIQDRWRQDSNELLVKVQYTFRR